MVIASAINASRTVIARLTTAVPQTVVLDHRPTTKTVVHVYQSPAQ
jgi:multisubunit Na+/H+ antiporter MnhE subunit